jgi:hypothetical protein
LKNPPRAAPSLAVAEYKLRNGASGVLDQSHQSQQLMEGAKWRNEFLPTLYHALYVSESPFKHFRKESDEFLKTVQDVFDIVYPDISYNLSVRDALVTLVPFQHNLLRLF